MWTGPGRPLVAMRERAGEDVRDILRALDRHAPLRDLREHAHEEIGLVHTVERLVGGPGRHGTADVDQRRRRHVGLRDAGERVGRAGSGGHQHHARLAGQPPIGIGHAAGGRLMLDGDVADRRRVGERIVDFEHVRADQPEDMLDPLGLERLDDRRAAALRDPRRAPCRHRPIPPSGKFFSHLAPAVSTGRHRIARFDAGSRDESGAVCWDRSSLLCACPPVLGNVEKISVQVKGFIPSPGRCTSITFRGIVLEFVPLHQER